jgi:outer membrane lipoprotein-sorting protein
MAWFKKLFLINGMLVLFLFLFLCGTYQAESVNTLLCEDEKPVLKKISDASSKVETLESEFTQERHMDLLENIAVSSGRFFYKRPDKMRWETISPAHSGFSVNGDKAKRWRGNHRVSQSFTLDPGSVIKIIVDQVFAWTKADFQWLENNYILQVLGVDPVTVKLVPKKEKKIEFITHLTLIFSNDYSHVEAVEVHESNGDFTRIRFFHTRINKSLNSDLF